MCTFCNVIYSKYLQSRYGIVILPEEEDIDVLKNDYEVELYANRYIADGQLNDCSTNDCIIPDVTEV